MLLFFSGRGYSSFPALIVAAAGIVPCAEPRAPGPPPWCVGPETPNFLLPRMTPNFSRHLGTCESLAPMGPRHAASSQFLALCPSLSSLS